MAAPPPPRTGRALRFVLIVLAIVIVLPLAGLAVFALTFDPNSVKPRIEQAVLRATGRDLALNGRLGLKLSLWPTLEARDVAFANRAGGSRPQMATVERVEAQIALLPLLSRRLEIERLVVVHPDLLLETDAAGQPNWQFGPTVPSQKLPKAEAPAATQAAASSRPLALSIHRVRIDGGTLTYRDGQTGRSTAIDLERIEATAEAADAPVDATIRAAYRGAPFAIDAHVGPLSRLAEPASTAPWPVRVIAAAGGAKLVLDGSLTDPLGGRGYQAQVDADIPDLAALAPFVRRASLPPLHNLHFAATVANAGAALPAFSALAARAGTSDLSAVLPGLTLRGLEVTAASLDQPVQFTAQAERNGAAVATTGSLGAPRQLLAGAGGGSVAGGGDRQGGRGDAERKRPCRQPAGALGG